MTAAARRLVTAFSMCLFAFALASAIAGSAWAVENDDAASTTTQENEALAAQQIEAGDDAALAGETAIEDEGAMAVEEAADDILDASEAALEDEASEESASETAEAEPMGGLTADNPEQGAEQDAENVALSSETDLAAGTADGLTTAAATSGGPLPDGVYTIFSMVSDQYVLDVSGGSKNSGANVQIYTLNNTDAQKWRLAYKDGFYTIQSVVSGKMLDVSGASTRNGANVQQYNSNNTNAQKWTLKALGNGQFTVVSALNSSFVLDVSGARAANGTNVQGYTSNNTNAQKWYFAPLGTLTGERVIEDGVYTISSALGNSLVLDVSGASYNDGANTQTYTSNNTNAQRWAFTWDNATRTYSIRNAANAKALDVNGGSTKSGANVQQYTWNGTNAQRWVVEKSGGSYVLRNAITGMALDVAGANKKAGTNVQVYVPNGTAAQKWNLAKANGAVADGIYNIYSMLSPTAQVIEVANASAETGAKLQTNALSTAFNQKLRLTRVSGDEYTMQAVHSGKYIANSNGVIVQADKSGGADQRWTITFDVNGLKLTSVSEKGKSIEVTGNAKNGAQVVVAATASADKQRYRLQTVNLISNGYYLVRNLNSGLPLDVNGASYATANVQQYTANDSPAQTFYIFASGDYYVIANAKSHKALDVAGGSKAAGANVQQYKQNGTNAQLWSATIDSACHFVFKNKGSGMVLEVAGASKASGANVRQGAAVANAAYQTWIVEPTKAYSVSGDVTLDKYIGDILGDHNSLWDAYYYVSTLSYREGNKIWSGKYMSDKTSISYAKEMVEYGSGNCFRFASLFSWLARGLGYKTNVVMGWVPSYSSGEAPHGWVEVYVNGKTYVCDPDMYNAIRDRDWYMRTYSDAPVEYHFW